MAEKIKENNKYEYDMTSRFLTEETIDNINYDLLDYINDNKITKIINILQNDNNKVSFNFSDKNGNSLLMAAIMQIKPDYITTFSIVCPFFSKRHYDILDVCPLLLKNNKNINKKNNYGETALILAVKNMTLKEHENGNKTGNYDNLSR